jgi:predicted ATPase
VTELLIRTPDQRLRVFVSSTLQELGPERQAAREAIGALRLAPVMFELGARPHPPAQVYRSYLAQSHIFVGIYWQSYGWVAPGEDVSGLEDEYRLSAGMPRLIYLKSPAVEREERLTELLARMEDDDDISFQRFSSPAELQRLVGNDLALLLSERFVPDRTRGLPTHESADQTAAEPMTPLVGREPEIESVADLVVRDHVRLITLTGPGGVGKTRLAMAIAARLAPEYPDGIRFIDLALVPVADLVPSALASDIGLSSAGDRLISDLKAYFRTRRLVLVLDNFEQVTQAAPLLADLLSTAPDIAILVSSRTVLRLTGEHEFPVPPLSVPPPAVPPAELSEPGTDAEVTEALQYPAVRLFTERAQSGVGGFRLTSQNVRVVAEICRRLDGLPLAIELAAAKVGLLSPEALLRRLDNRLRLLTGGARDVPERQRTLRATLDWSFELLDKPAQQLFARLGVFAGGFDLPAAEAVRGDGDALPAAGSLDAADTVDSLAALMDASLVRQEEGTVEPRFTMLETIREYARERLSDGAQWREAHERHSRYFTTLAEQAAPELEGPSPMAGLDRLEVDYDNLRAAMEWLVEQGPLVSAVELGWAIWRFWWFRGHTEEWARLGEKILAESDELPPFDLARALAGIAYMLLASGEKAKAQPLFERSLPLFEQAGNEFCVALAEGSIGYLSVVNHEYDRATRLLNKSLELQKQLGNDAYVALVYNFLGQIPLSQGDAGRAAELFTKALAAARCVPDRLSLLLSLYDLAVSRQVLGDLTSAAGLLGEGLTLSAETGDEASVAYHLQELATVLGKLGDPERAARMRAAAASLLDAVGTGWLQAYMPPRPTEADVTADLRSQLGAAAFDESWGQGVAMGRGTAVRDALEGVRAQVAETADPATAGS